MFQQPHRLSFHQLVDHITQNGSDGIEPLIGMTDIRQSRFIEKDFLNDEDGNGFGEFGACFHDAEAERDDLGGEEEVNDGVIVILL
jgi:hypothetical protein